MSFSTRILLGLALLLAAGHALGDGVDHYELAPSVMRANGQPIYPAGVSDPSLANPPGPSPENAVPIPPTPGLPGARCRRVRPSECRRSVHPRRSVRPSGRPAARPARAIPPPGTANPGAWSSPAAVQTQVYPSAAAVPEAETASPSQLVRARRVLSLERADRRDGLRQRGRGPLPRWATRGRSASNASAPNCSAAPCITQGYDQSATPT